LKAKNDPWEAGANEGGYINLAVAQNFLTVAPVQERLRAAMAVEQPTSAAGYDNMRGSHRARTAMAAHMQRVLAGPAAAPGTVDPHQLCISVGCGAVIDNLVFSICEQGLTLVCFSAQRKHFLCTTHAHFSADVSTFRRLFSAAHRQRVLRLI
jgi:aspartate/methionine/tyrosine aminotransferase